MTVASAKSRIPRPIREYIWPETQSSRYAVVQRNFESIDSPIQRKNLIDQLDLLLSDPRKTQAFLLSEKGQENRKAFKLLKEMIKSGDADVASKSKRIFAQYLEASITKQNLMGPSIDPGNATKAETAFETLVSFINEENQAKRASQAKEIANSCGYLYQETGDDRNNTTWRRGSINSTVKAGRDARLFNFFHNMQKTESGRLLHELSLEAGLQDLHKQLYTGHINGTETGLSNEVRDSLDQQTKASSPALNPSRLWGDKSFIDTIQPSNADETKFLNSFKRSANFKFSIAKLESGYLSKNTRDRKALVLDFMAAFELLSYRKACLIKSANVGDDPLLNRAAKRIEAQQKRMLEALKEHSGREPELAQAIEDMFKAQGTSVFMYHMVGALGSAEKSVSTLVAKEAADMAKQYGASAVVLKSSKTVTDSYQDLMTLKKETEERVESSSVSFANTVLAGMSRPELLDDKAISAFERHSGASVVLSASVTTAPATPSSPLTADDTRWAEIQKVHSNKNPAPTYFGLDAACADFKSQVTASTDPSIQYAITNFERIYGLTLDEVLQKVKDREVIHAKEGTFLINSSDRFCEQVQQVLKEARKTNSNKPKDFDFCHAVTSAKYSSSMQNIILGEHTLAPERLIAKIVNDDTKAHQGAGFGIESVGQLERLLISPDLDTDDKVNIQRSERIIGIFELERRILKSIASDADKKAAIEYIHNSLLGESGFTIAIADLTSYQASLDSVLGTGARDYTGILRASPASGLTALLKDRYALDDLSISTGNISRSVMGFMRRESELLISGFEGNLPDGMFSSDEPAMIETISGIRSKIQTALDADKLEAEAEAVQAMVDDFSKVGFPVEQLFPSGSIDDGSWKNHFIFADELFHSPDGQGSDIIQILIEIWQNILRGLSK